MASKNTCFRIFVMTQICQGKLASNFPGKFIVLRLKANELLAFVIKGILEP